MFNRNKEKKIKEKVRIKYNGVYIICDYLDKGIELDSNHPYYNLSYIRYKYKDPVNNEYIFFTFDNGKTFLLCDEYLKLSKK